MSKAKAMDTNTGINLFEWDENIFSNNYEDIPSGFLESYTESGILHTSSGKGLSKYIYVNFL